MKAGEIWNYKEQPSWSNAFNRWVLHSIELIEYLGDDKWKIRSVAKDSKTKEIGFESQGILSGAIIFMDYIGPINESW
jgi:hypothetical protein